jgi:hypothetical protein
VICWEQQRENQLDLRCECSLARARKLGVPSGIRRVLDHVAAEVGRAVLPPDRAALADGSLRLFDRPMSRFFRFNILARLGIATARLALISRRTRSDLSCSPRSHLRTWTSICRRWRTRRRQFLRALGSRGVRQRAAGTLDDGPADLFRLAPRTPELDFALHGSGLWDVRCHGPCAAPGTFFE